MISLGSGQESPLSSAEDPVESGNLKSDGPAQKAMTGGTFANRQRYDRIAIYRAGSGYVVMMPQHVDADYGATPTTSASWVIAAR